MMMARPASRAFVVSILRRRHGCAVAMGIYETVKIHAVFLAFTVFQIPKRVFRRCGI